MKADQSGRLALIEMTFNSLANIGPKFIQCIGFGNDIRADPSRDETAFGGLFNDEQ